MSFDRSCRGCSDGRLRPAVVVGGRWHGIGLEPGAVRNATWKRAMLRRAARGPHPGEAASDSACDPPPLVTAPGDPAAPWGRRPSYGVGGTLRPATKPSRALHMR
jgi:hypothetical protein